MYQTIPMFKYNVAIICIGICIHSDIYRCNNNPGCVRSKIDGINEYKKHN